MQVSSFLKFTNLAMNRFSLFTRHFGIVRRHRGDRQSITKTILYFIPITTFGLGCWQVYRLQWKLALIQKAEDAIKGPIKYMPW